MNILPVSINNTNCPSFKHVNPWEDSTYNTKEKFIAGTTTALGVAGVIAMLAKHSGYSLKPQKIFDITKEFVCDTPKLIVNGIKSLFNKKTKTPELFKNWKKSYLHKVEYDDKPVIAIGAGSCLGGLAGGYIIDKNKENRKAKQREAILQMFNISVPILFVTRCARLGKYVGNKYFEKNPIKETFRTKLPKAIGGIVGIIAGVYSANFIGNKINEKIFHKGKGRNVQASDFSAHLDDFCVAAQQISDNKVVHGISRFVPVALMVAGNEVANKN